MTLLGDFYSLSFYGYYYDTDEEFLNDNAENKKVKLSLSQSGLEKIQEGPKEAKSRKLVKYLKRKRLDRNGLNFYRVMIIFTI